MIKFILNALRNRKATRERQKRVDEFMSKLPRLEKNPGVSDNLKNLDWSNLDFHTDDIVWDEDDIVALSDAFKNEK